MMRDCQRLHESADIARQIAERKHQLPSDDDELGKPSTTPGQADGRCLLAAVVVTAKAWRARVTDDPRFYRDTLSDTDSLHIVRHLHDHAGELVPEDDGGSLPR
jgi:hypothetical protein